MEEEKREELLKKFYMGETTMEEESLLREELKQEPGHLSAEPGMLWLIAGEKEVPEPSAGFNERLENITRIEKRLSTRTKRMLYLTSVAASVAAVTIICIRLFTAPSQPEDTFNDPALALAEVRNILGTVSSNLRSGTEPLTPMKNLTAAPDALSGLGRINETVHDNLGKLKYLNKTGSQPGLDSEKK